MTDGLRHEKVFVLVLSIYDSLRCCTLATAFLILWLTYKSWSNSSVRRQLGSEGLATKIQTAVGLGGLVLYSPIDYPLRLGLGCTCTLILNRNMSICRIAMLFSHALCNRFFLQALKSSCRCCATHA